MGETKIILWNEKNISEILNVFFDNFCINGNISYEISKNYCYIILAHMLLL